MCGVAENFNGGATGPEHHQRTEGLIDRHANNELVGVGAPDHRLNGEACDAGMRQLGGDALQHLVGGALGILRALQPQPDPADVGLVRDIIGENLDHAGVVLGDDGVRQAGRPPPGCARFRSARPGCRRRRAGLWPRVPTTTTVQASSAAAIVALARSTSNCNLIGKGRRSAHQLFLRSGMTHQLHEGIDRFRRRGETRDLVGCKFARAPLDWLRPRARWRASV